MLPNAPIPVEKSLTDFVVPLSVLEAAVGIQFFPGLPLLDMGDAVPVPSPPLALPPPAEDVPEAGAAGGVFATPATPAEEVVGAELTIPGVVPAPSPPTPPQLVDAAALPVGRAHLCTAFRCTLPEPDFWLKKPPPA